MKIYTTTISCSIVTNLEDINVKIKTDDFYNDSLTCRMKTDYKGTFLYIVYKSKPNGKLDSKDQIDYGTFVIKCDEDLLEGTFYTSSCLSGKVELYRK